MPRNGIRIDGAEPAALPTRAWCSKARTRLRRAWCAALSRACQPCRHVPRHDTPRQVFEITLSRRCGTAPELSPRLRNPDDSLAIERSSTGSGIRCARPEAKTTAGVPGTFGMRTPGKPPLSVSSGSRSVSFRVLRRVGLAPANLSFTRHPLLRAAESHRPHEPWRNVRHVRPLRAPAWRLPSHVAEPLRLRRVLGQASQHENPSLRARP